jgi:hypothetical protein
VLLPNELVKAAGASLQFAPLHKVRASSASLRASSAPDLAQGVGHGEAIAEERGARELDLKEAG